MLAVIVSCCGHDEYLIFIPSSQGLDWEDASRRVAFPRGYRPMYVSYRLLPNAERISVLLVEYSFRLQSEEYSSVPSERPEMVFVIF